MLQKQSSELGISQYVSKQDSNVWCYLYKQISAYECVVIGRGKDSGFPLYDE